MNNLLIKALSDKQRELGLSGRQFSELLGLDPTTWSLYSRGLRKPGAKFFGGVIREFPDLRSLVDVEIVNKAGGVYKTTPQSHQDKHRTVFHWLRYQYLLLKRKLRRASHGDQKR